jgi:hypothetical protein
MSGLCEYCQDVFPQTVPLGTHQKHYAIGTFQWVRHHAHHHPICPFCKLVSKAIKLEYGTDDFGRDNDDKTFYVTRTPHGFALGKKAEDPMEDFTTTIVPIVATLPGKNPTGYGQDYGNRVSNSLMKNWFEQCWQDLTNNHGSCVQRDVWRRRAGNDRHGLSILRLLDVSDLTKLCIVELNREDGNADTSSSPAHQYAVLSYQIGGVNLPKYDRHDMRNKGVPGAVHLSHLPQVYQDAIWLAKKVGLDYLWIDALCLMSDKKGGHIEKADHHHGIDNMDRIYEGAMLTIVAADTPHANGHLEALQTMPTGRALQPRETINGKPWTVSKGLYDRLHNQPYSTRGWTYQELILSHRCLIFVDGLAYFRCRTRLYAEDNFYYNHDTEPSVAVMPQVYRTDFLPRNIKDPWDTYRRNLVAYRYREISDVDNTVNAFQGILNRICEQLDTRLSIEGLPEGMLDMAMVWYNNPGANRAIGWKPHRLHAFPSWTWAAWKGPESSVPESKGLMTVPWVPDGMESDRQHWVKHHAGKIEYWSQRNDGSFRQAKSGAPRGVPPPYPAGVPPGLDCNFLIIKTRVSQDFRLTFPHGGLRGSCELRTQQGALLGIVYADDFEIQPGPHPAMLAMLCSAPDGDDSFDYAYPEGDISSMPNPPISAKDTSLRWVLLLAHAGFGNCYRRAGLGFIHTDKLPWINWSQQAEYVNLV